MKELNEIINQFEQLGDPKNVEGMKRFAVFAQHAYGVATPVVKSMAKAHKNNQALALALWETGSHEPRVLATLVADRKQFTKKQMDAWVRDFDSWAVCDSACFNLFRYLPFAGEKVYKYAPSNKEFVRRTAFSLIAGMAIGVKNLDDDVFLPYLDLIIEYAGDERNFVRKAVNWALRQIGKRNTTLHKEALKAARQLKESDNKTARWIGSDAYRELTNPKIVARIKAGN